MTVPKRTRPVDNHRDVDEVGVAHHLWNPRSTMCGWQSAPPQTAETEGECCPGLDTDPPASPTCSRTVNVASFTRTRRVGSTSEGVPWLPASDPSPLSSVHAGSSTGSTRGRSVRIPSCRGGCAGRARRLCPRDRGEAPAAVRRLSVSEQVRHVAVLFTHVDTPACRQLAHSVVVRAAARFRYTCAEISSFGGSRSIVGTIVSPIRS